MHNLDLITLSQVGLLTLPRPVYPLSANIQTNTCSVFTGHAGETNPDYDDDDYGGEDPPRAPGHLEEPTAAPLIPYFKEGQVVVYVNSSAKTAKLDCPVQNYDGK